MEKKTGLCLCFWKQRGSDRHLQEKKIFSDLMTYKELLRLFQKQIIFITHQADTEQPQPSAGV